MIKTVINERIFVEIGICVREGKVMATGSKRGSSQFCVEIHKFSLPWQQGRCVPNFTYTVLLADPDNPTLESKIMALSYTEPEL